MIASQQIFQTCSSTVVTEKYHEWNENPKGRPSDIKQNATGCVKNDGTKRLLTSGWVPGTGSERTSAHGTQLFGGGIVTAGGLIFIGACQDEKFRAIDKTTGEILWEYQLPCGCPAAAMQLPQPTKWIENSTWSDRARRHAMSMLRLRYLKPYNFCLPDARGRSFSLLLFTSLTNSFDKTFNCFRSQKSASGIVNKCP